MRAIQPCDRAPSSPAPPGNWIDLALRYSTSIHQNGKPLCLVLGVYVSLYVILVGAGDSVYEHIDPWRKHRAAGIGQQATAAVSSSPNGDVCPMGIHTVHEHRVIAHIRMKSGAQGPAGTDGIPSPARILRSRGRSLTSRSRTRRRQNTRAGRPRSQAGRAPPSASLRRVADARGPRPLLRPAPLPHLAPFRRTSHHSDAPRTIPTHLTPFRRTPHYPPTTGNITELGFLTPCGPVPVGGTE